MPNQSGKIVLVLILILLLSGTAVYFLLPGFKSQNYTESEPGYSTTTPVKNETEGGTKDYKSEDLKISFNYPSKWIIDERYLEVLIANFKTSLNSNKEPKKDEIQIIIHRARGCHKTIDENLKDPACGEGGPSVKPNEILSKETEDIDGIKFHKYLVKYSNGKEQRFYFLEKGDRVLQIDKDPDPSMFEKEFEEIVKSIKFN